MLRIRLRRVGKKKAPAYRVVVADSRSPRDGRFVDIVGTYDPLTEPSTVHIDEQKVRDWLRKGAQPSDTVVRLLKRTGVSTGAAGAAAVAVATPLVTEAEAPVAVEAEPETESETEPVAESS